MKTFKLASLDIVDSRNSGTVHQSFPLLDGLIINREDEENRWIVEAFLENKYYDFFTELCDKNKEVIIQVHITKKSNAPATFITSVIGVNEIGKNMNVLFRGTIVNHQKEIVEDKLKALIDEGYNGEKLLEKFKESM
ncbi:YwpF-like family protein [Virgibacillus kekensis]|uniref:YwpF-like family protein n=1 Tax=Virgibacillus kekensis TaxID=202261 RepID=A0ABV9DGH7_9BACI